jgi:protein TonB
VLFVTAIVLTPALAGAQMPVRVGGAVKEPRPILKADPVYPAIALAANVEGQVIIEATIDREGKVTNARVLRSAPLFEEAAIAAVRQWTYEPSQLNGVPVEVLMTVVVNFRLPAAVPATQEQLLNQRLAAAPTDAGAMIDLAKVYRDRGLLNEAARMLERALDQVKSEAAAAGTGAASPTAPVRIGGDVKEPKRITIVPPVYPAIASQANVSGQVILEIIIAKDGTVRSARVLRSIPLFDQAALDAVKQWVYEPTLLRGEPVEVAMTVVVNFQLR